MKQRFAAKIRGIFGSESFKLKGSILVAFRVTAKSGEFFLPNWKNFPPFPLSSKDLYLLEDLVQPASKPLSAQQLDNQNLLDELRRRAVLQDAPLRTLAANADYAQTSSVEIPAGKQLAILRPFVLRLDEHGYSFLDHQERVLLRMTASELSIASLFWRPATTVKVFEKHSEVIHLDYNGFTQLVERLVTAGLLQQAEFITASGDRTKQEFSEVMKINKERRRIVQQCLEQTASSEEKRYQQTGIKRTQVVPVQTETQPLLSHGLLMSYAMEYQGGRLLDSYEFVRDWCNVTLPAMEENTPPAIFLFSNYVWSHASNMASSKLAKEKNPGGLCIHGGPDTPKYKQDIPRYLELNPHIDIIVHGEGELTLAELLDILQPQLAANSWDLSVLQSVAGITYRTGKEIFHTATRERIADLDILPSPYTNGMFDNIGNLPIVMQTIETNRGCPFGCTFCDWGSATLSKIRKFDLERVFSDLEWCAKNKVKTVFNTDANFGVFERDIEIARKVVELKEQYGYPKVFESSYAKNQVKHLKTIIQILADGGVVSVGTLSLQSVSPDTLKAIKRSNIKVSKYDELAVEFARAKLPLIVEMMMGLPGSTLESFEGDLQQAIDREVPARVNPTEALVNSPMNAPDYRAEFAINLKRPIEQDWEAASNEGKRPAEKTLVISTSTFSAADYDGMGNLRRLFMLMENHGVLRQVSRFVRFEKGTLEMTFYRQLAEQVLAQPRRWPSIEFALYSMSELMLPPGSWKTFINEVRDYLVTELDIEADSALETVLQVQHALLPARDRQFPLQLQLPHDYAAWHSSMVASKEKGWELDWTLGIKPLGTFTPALFSVSDPQNMCSLGMGGDIDSDGDFDWELGSPVGRTLRFRRGIALN